MGNIMLTRLAVKVAAPIPKIESFQRYLFVGPHPDDLEIGAGATISKLVQEGKDICFLICADGRYGDGFVDKSVTRDQLIEMRIQETLKSAKFLGVEDVRFLGFSDGGFYDTKDLVRGIAKVAGEFKPDIVLGPDYFVSSESHPDHLNVGKAVREIAFSGPYKGIMEQYGADSAPIKAVGYYMTAHPNTFVGTNGHFKKQIDSIKLHVSQFPEGCGELNSIITYLKIRNIEFGLRSFHMGAEGFRVLTPTHMHCLPEAGL